MISELNAIKPILPIFKKKNTHIHKVLLKGKLINNYYYTQRHIIIYLKKETDKI